MGAHYEVSKNRDGEYIYKLFDGDGAMLVVSRGYSVAATCEGGLRSLKRVAPIACIEDRTVARPLRRQHPKYEIFEVLDGVSFQLKARNGEVIVFGGVFAQKTDCVNAIKALRETVREAPAPSFSDIESAEDK